MAHFIQARTLSTAWIDALEVALDAGGKDVHLVVQWRGHAEDAHVRQTVDQFLEARRQEYLARNGKKGWTVWSVETVANTIFPLDLYLPEKGDDAIPLFTDFYQEGREFAHAASPEGEYCERLVAWPGPDGAINQLEAIAIKLRRVRDRDRAGRGSLSSDYELAIAHPADTFDLRVHAPGLNNSPYGFPCLSHLSVTIHDGELHLAAMYRNQHLARKGYGNYLGLSRLGLALANEVGLPLGEVMVVATHADAEVGTARGFGRGALRQVVADGRKDVKQQ
ncbi:MAG: hypothetical protein M3396_01210 [Actinomycetota bacterium]|nr:hypothetical protein [Actinomycetota bacterium]